ncbi:MAG: cytochrome C [Myxococcota bacterium]
MTRPTRSLAELLLAATFTTPPAAASEPPTPSAGAELVELCARCHALSVGEKARWGPDLVGVVGRPVGAEPGYSYGSYLVARNRDGAVWDEAALRVWLVDAKAVARTGEARTKMPTLALTDDQLDVLLPFLREL